MKKNIPMIECDVCEKNAPHDKAIGKWLHIQFYSMFGEKPKKNPEPVDLCSATCAKKWVTTNPTWNEDIKPAAKPVATPKPVKAKKKTKEVVTDGAGPGETPESSPTV